MQPAHPCSDTEITGVFAREFSVEREDGDQVRQLAEMEGSLYICSKPKGMDRNVVLGREMQVWF